MRKPVRPWRTEVRSIEVLQGREMVAQAHWTHNVEKQCLEWDIAFFRRPLLILPLGGLSLHIHDCFAIMHQSKVYLVHMAAHIIAHTLLTFDHLSMTSFGQGKRAGPTWLASLVHMLPMLLWPLSIFSLLPFPLKLHLHKTIYNALITTSNSNLQQGVCCCAFEFHRPSFESFGWVVAQ